ncbi:hypothetical protein C8A00DRAFT_44275 [Chaetomidium leptoderma]|uniref:Zn(2)-C6 fungal-type domain-containing protein n=1 Tax=Chaetomidium leptoderma TaxID=669021 RepID=A0AAN6VJG5_9PEZI|nr:hypothetical protein C8A00DRAFT_44275 [Chaetomidium leptoderma]
MTGRAQDGPNPALDITSHVTAPSVTAPSLAQSIHCFQFRTADRPRRSIRAKFTTQEREKVLSVRRQGACLRCRILKIQCSLDNPCQPCLQSAVKGSERKVLSFCYCVRTRFGDVNIFQFDSSSEAEAAFVTMRTETLMRTMSGLLARIATPANFSLTSNPAAFNNTMVSWLTDRDFHLPNGSIVGLCCSSLLGLQFQDETTTDTDDLVTDFRRFLLATSLTHAGWRDSSSSAAKARDLCAAAQISGCRLIKRLDRVLTPQFLARFDRDSCQVLFLLVLGTVLGVGYSSSRLEHDSPEFPAAETLSLEFQRSPTLWVAMKEHLCQMLAHHLIFVGSMLGIKLDTSMEQRIIDTAVSRWRKAEEFVWADVPEMPGAVKSEEEKSVLGERSLQLSSSCSPPLPRPQPPQLVPIPWLEIKQFQPQTAETWSENPKSYLSMFDEPVNSDSDTQTPRATQEEAASPTMSASEPNAQLQGSEPVTWPQERKRRSIWIVRPFDAGPERGMMNVRARVRGQMGMESLRAFV